MGTRFKPSPSVLVGQAVRALVRNKTRSALSAIGITIGIAAVVWVIALGKAGSERAEDQLRELGVNLVWVEAGSRNVAGVRTGTHGTTSLTLGDAEAIRREVPLIERLSPQVDGGVLAIYGDRNWTTRYRGIAPDYIAIKSWRLAAGSLFTEEDLERASNVCVIGQTVRERLFGSIDPIGRIIRVAGQPFEVVGVLAPKGQSATGQDQDDTLMLPYTTAQKKLRGNGLAWLDDILCSAIAPEAAGQANLQIAELLRQRHHIGLDQEDDFNIRHPEELIKAQMETSATFATLLVCVGAVSLLVGGIGILNVMLASVAERTREIGVRLAVGASERAVQMQFLAEAVLLTSFGGLLGIVVSVLGSSVMSRLLGWNVTIPVEAILLAVLFSAAVGIAFGFIPARKAAQLDPIEALRAE